MNILGINAYHGDSAAALLQDGKIIAAVEEERFTRIKHWAGLPIQSIRYCLEAGGIDFKELDHVAVSFNPQANVANKALFVLKNRPSLRVIFDRLQRQSKGRDIASQLSAEFGANGKNNDIKYHYVEHHLCHIASTYYTSAFDQAAILSVDGMGDFVSTLPAYGNGTSVTTFDRTLYPHSLGFLYNALTLYLGFPNYGDEYKVMGLAPYGEPAYIEKFREIVKPTGDSFQLNLDYFTHHKKGISMAWDTAIPKVDPFHSELLAEVFGSERGKEDELTKHHEDIAASVQAVSEEILFHLLNRLYERNPTPNLCLAGGVAMNSVANGKICQNTPFENVHVPVGAADNGTSFGAALHVWHATLEQTERASLSHAYLGPAPSKESCKAALKSKQVSFKELVEEQLYDETTTALMDGKVVGWFQGGMEFGARALGNRSLLADPRRTDMRDIINLRIKFREKFRPFAPSVLESAAPEFFDNYHPTPFMERVLPIKKEKQELIPAVTHVDGSGRLQTVSKEGNSRYWNLISHFEKKTGVPILLNTSLNENEPIVCRPEEAIDCFARTAMDVLVLGDIYIDRNDLKDS